ncbi:MAG: hypothetical protein WBD07_16520 [Vicinamibacterales bacterium]
MTTLLVLTLMSALLIGFTAVIMGDQRFRLIDRDRSRAFYAAMAGLEKMTADLGNLFFVNVAPTPAQVANLTVAPPALADTAFVRADGTSGYTITAGAPSVQTISSGPYQGLMALLTLYSMDVTARTTTGGDVHLQRQTETVAIPVFQFGMFSDVDLSFFAGPNFDFGGRIHTNANLFLSEGAGGTLTLRDKVTAVREIIRNRLQNGVAIGTSGHTGPVSMAKSTNSFRNLLAGAPGEGSVVDGAGPPMSAVNEPTWHTVSLSTYNGYIRNGRTGARPLNLPVLTLGGANVAIIQRAPANENVANPLMFAERFFSQTSVRILLSDNAADITGLPGVTAAAPVLLDGDWVAAPPAGYGPVDATHPPIATSRGPNSSTITAAVAAGAALINVTNNAGTHSFKPVITLQGVPVTCTGKTALTFTGCVGTPAAPNAAPVTWRNAATTLTAATAAGAATINVVATAAFVPQPFWLATVAGAGQPANNLVQCTGYTPTTFTGCAGTPAAPNNAVFTSNALSNAGTGTIGGFIKIEIQNAALAWQDVTLQILNYGIGGPNLAGGGQICDDPTPNAILRIQRLRDNAQNGANGGGCNYASVGGAGAVTRTSTDFWPNTLFDTREAVYRDVAPAGNALVLGGVMHYISLDVRNLSRWLQCVNGAVPGGSYGPPVVCSGTNAKLHDNNGYSVYFSDRRNNRDAANAETGEFGWEDFVNPASATGAPNNVADLGENVNGNVDGGGNPILDIYGRLPAYNGVSGAVPPGALAPLDGNARPTTLVSSGQAIVNRALHFRRALKLINGGLGNIVMPGLTVASENPVYVQGNWNMAAWPQVAQAGDNHAATSVIADSVTLLSNAWSDNISYTQPYLPGNRVRSAQTFYRLAIISGKGPAFPQPPQPVPGGAANPWDFGTDGGAHNFLHFLEGGGNTVNYAGSIATFYFNRQAVGTYKCCNTVYAPPTRNFAFDIGFLNPALLPPGTPVFRDLNTIGFFVENRPGR